MTQDADGTGAVRVTGWGEVAAAGQELDFGEEKILGVMMSGLGMRSLGELRREKVPRGSPGTHRGEWRSPWWEGVISGLRFQCPLDLAFRRSLGKAEGQ